VANPLTLASAEDLAKGREGNKALLSDILSIPQTAYSNAVGNVQQIGQFAKDMATDPAARQRFGAEFAAQSNRPIDPQDVQNAALSFAPGGMTLAGMTTYHGTPHKFEPTSNGGSPISTGVTKYHGDTQKIEPSVKNPVSEKGKNYIDYSISSDTIFDHEGNEFEGPEYHLIDKIYVQPNERGTGKASKMLKETIEKMQKTRPDLPIKVNALPFDKNSSPPGLDMEELVRFYEKHGFDIENTEGNAVGLVMPALKPKK
jgi:hypothetical protein